jgi:hypothetical protein
MPPLPSIVPTSIPVGNPMKFSVSFFDENNVAFDPASGIQITAVSPAGINHVLTYPADLTKNGVGTYSVVIEATEKGLWSGFGTGKLPNGMDVTTDTVYQRVG